ncbi:ABC transporter ATP-binding protein/permease [Lutimonas saemankumensis]|uniref:ABC transporter ATP-binding protein n=1 Tax=Lutimonas saemankumensis TaxID=483016 RepID=UPI001CD7A73A|nr:ABC transporter ATP-binding protein [Lutimonas saemankumensis]MCA0931479.1 ABC transporter ATP-binding protein/permease [Lutimonas saemankumensis]
MKALRYLNKFFYKYRARLILGILITIVAKVFALQIPQLIKESLNVVEDYTSNRITDLEIVKSQLILNILYIIGAALLSGFFTFLMRQTLIVMSRLIEFDLKNEIFHQYEMLSLNFYKRNRTGDLMNRISEDVGKVRMYFGPAIMYTMNMLVLFIIAITKMWNIDQTLTMYTLMPLPVLSVSIYILSRIINKRSNIVQQYLSKLTTNAQETFSGINVVKAYSIEGFTSNTFSVLANTSKDKNISLYKAQALFFPLMILLIGISNILVIYIGGMQYINGEIQNIGIIAEFIIYVNMLTWPVAVVGWVTSIIQQAEVSQKRINEFLKQKPSIKNLVEEPSVIKGNIEFKNVSFEYEDTNITALKNISFKVDQGKTIAIMGRTGSGKSTIAALVARLYDSSSGEILVDGTPVRDLNLESLRGSIGFVPQDAFLFSDTIADNIRIGNENASTDQIEKAAKSAYIYDNIMNFSQKFETLVGERGVTLSGGQKQRVSIARALISDPEILIFDDCLSAVDTETEEIILQNLDEATKGKTTFIISHRASSVKNADQIIVLEEGRIVQSGTHDELLVQEGYYQDIYNQQLEEKLTD